MSKFYWTVLAWNWYPTNESSHYVFGQGHKNLKKLSCFSDVMYTDKRICTKWCQIKLAKFCVLLRIYQLYKYQGEINIKQLQCISFNYSWWIHHYTKDYKKNYTCSCLHSFTSKLSQNFGNQCQNWYAKVIIIQVGSIPECAPPLSSDFVNKQYLK